MSSDAKRALVAITCVAIVGIIVGCAQGLRSSKGSAGAAAKAKRDAEIDAKARAMAASDMAQWKRKNPTRARSWIEVERASHKIMPIADNSSLLKGEQGKGHSYGNYTERDILVWERETEKLVVEGSRVFHNATLLGGTVGVSCDMCHPDAANTHPETYPKFQAQLGRVVLLRDVINWCIENPVRGKALAADDPKMRALEAYIMAQRSGVEMEYGKH